MRLRSALLGLGLAAALGAAAALAPRRSERPAAAADRAASAPSGALAATSSPPACMPGTAGCAPLLPACTPGVAAPGTTALPGCAPQLPACAPGAAAPGAAVAPGCAPQAATAPGATGERAPAGPAGDSLAAGLAYLDQIRAIPGAAPLLDDVLESMRRDPDVVSLANLPVDQHGFAHIDGQTTAVMIKDPAIRRKWDKLMQLIAEDARRQAGH